jgi:hypothetical protein
MPAWRNPEVRKTATARPDAILVHPSSAKLDLNQERSIEKLHLVRGKHPSRSEGEDEEDTNETPTYRLHAGRIKRRKFNG